MKTTTTTAAKRHLHRHPVRPEDARQWLADNQGWAAGLPAEVVGVSITGKITFRAVPGADQPEWYRDGYSTRTGAGQPLGYTTKGLDPMCPDVVDNNGDITYEVTTGTTGEIPNARRDYVHTPVDYAALDTQVIRRDITRPADPRSLFIGEGLPLPVVVAHVLTRNARIEAQADTQHLSDTTWTTYTTRSRSMWAAKGIHTGRKYQVKVAQLERQLRAALDTHHRRTYGVQLRTAHVEALATDTTFISAQDLTALVEVLRQGGLTAKEMETLECRAFEGRVDDSRRLLKAQLKAQALLA